MPVVYVDWNAIQYLAADHGGGQLTASLLGAVDRGDVWVPFTAAHVLDATAGWETLAGEVRDAVHRKMLFADGLTGAVYWSREGGRQMIEHRAMRLVADAIGMFIPRTCIVEPAAEEAIRQMVREAVEEGRRKAAVMPEEAKRISLAMTESLEMAYAEGVPAFSGSSSSFMAMMWPVFETILPGLRAHGLPMDRLASAQPEAAVLELDGILRQLDPAWSAERVVELACGGEHDPDDVGPMLLGTFGFYSEERRKLRRASPGPIADTSHGRFALSSAVFITGDERLAMRVDAWAHHTHRGIGHSRWPIVVTVKPGEPEGFARAAGIVDALTAAFPRAAAEFGLRTSDKSED